MNEMYTIYVHFPCAEDYIDKAVQLEIQMPFVPRIGDCLFIDHCDNNGGIIKRTSLPAINPSLVSFFQGFGLLYLSL